MQYIVKYLSAAVLIFSLIVVVERAEGMERTSLPAFEVTRLDGVATKSSQMVMKGQRWLIIYVRPHCLPCDSILSLLKSDHQGVIVVVGGTMVEAKGMVRKFPKAPSASWYADPKKEAFLQLKLQGTPVILGVDQGIIEWGLEGVIPHPGDLISIMTTWMKE